MAARDEILGVEQAGNRDIDKIAVRGIAGTISIGQAPRFRIPHGVLLPVAFLAETWTRITGGGEPFVTIDGLRMARKKMYFSHAKAARALGYKPRPAAQGLADAVRWFKEQGYVG